MCNIGIVSGMGPCVECTLTLGFQMRPRDADLRDGGSASHLQLLCAGMGPVVPQDQHLSDASEGEKVSTGK